MARKIRKQFSSTSSPPLAIIISARGDQLTVYSEQMLSDMKDHLAGLGTEAWVFTFSELYQPPAAEVSDAKASMFERHTKAREDLEAAQAAEIEALYETPLPDLPDSHIGRAFARTHTERPAAEAFFVQPTELPLARFWQAEGQSMVAFIFAILVSSDDFAEKMSRRAGIEPDSWVWTEARWPGSEDVPDAYPVVVFKTAFENPEEATRWYMDQLASYWQPYDDFEPCELPAEFQQKDSARR